MITFAPFDNKYTAPLHGFKDADDYYRRCSSAKVIGAIEVPAEVGNFKIEIVALFSVVNRVAGSCEERVVLGLD